MSQDLDTRLAASLKLRTTLQSEQQKLIGKYEAAAKELENLEQEIRAKGFDPATLDTDLARLQEQYARDVAVFEREVLETQAAMTPYLEVA